MGLEAATKALLDAGTPMASQLCSFNLNTEHKKASHTTLSKLRLLDTVMVILRAVR